MYAFQEIPADSSCERGSLGGQAVEERRLGRADELADGVVLLDHHDHGVGGVPERPQAEPVLDGVEQA
jgi:hypothetical protein